MGKQKVALRVNGVSYEREIDPRMTLGDFLRHEIGLTGTHLGCEHGVCGACTVLINGLSGRSCLAFAVQEDGSEITTVEALAENGELNILQQCFQEHHALQCGYCTPGMLMTLTELLRDHPKPSEKLVRDTLGGNLCRCTGYAAIVDAALDAAQRLAAAREA